MTASGWQARIARWRHSMPGKSLVVVVAQLIDAQGQVHLSIFAQLQGLQQRIGGPINRDRLFLRQLEDGQAVGGQVGPSPDPTVKQEAVRAGVPHKSGVLKVGVVHCRTLRRGLGEVVAALSALSHMGRLVLRAVWDVLPLF